MKKWILAYRSALFGLVVLLVASCGQNDKASPNAEDKFPVVATPVVSKVIPRTLEFAGNTFPWRESNFGAQTAGRIEHIYVDAGDEVAQGDTLVAMDDTPLLQAKIRHDVAKSDFERSQPLLDEGSLSPQQFDKIRAEFESARAAYELLRRNTFLTAPFSGVVTEKFMNEGEIFTMSPTARGSAPAIIALMQVRPLKILVNATESDFPSIKIGMPADVLVDIYPGRVFSGEVSRIAPIINDRSRTFEVEVRVANEDRTLRPGMFARVALTTGEDQVLIVPRAAIIRQLGSAVTYCFVANGDRAEYRVVQTGRTFNELVEIRSGLVAGDSVVIKGQYRLRDGALVQHDRNEEKSAESSQVKR